MKVMLTKEWILTMRNPKLYIDRVTMATDGVATIFACVGRDEEYLFSMLDVKYVTTLLGDKLFKLVTTPLADDDRVRLFRRGQPVIDKCDIEHIVETYEPDSQIELPATKEYDRIVVTEFHTI